MKDKAEVNINPLKLFVLSLSASFIIGELYKFYFNLHLFINILGFALIILFVTIFILSVKIFVAYNEKLPPSTPTFRIIKTGIYSYTRNPIYIAFVGFQLGMFLLFENIIYLISSILLFIWIHYMVVLKEEKYLEKKFGDSFVRYANNVPRWLFR
ncbi:MAG: hypothetical protein CMI95_06890 [Pelagibacteraceae bacterium]|nr:hypothetical protein [Pelagibacteraceae bacterium]PPR51504.1 MAG: hypothetical protein CFH20_00570 [Alphaproteobacteria bacterium MarineAlpha5_Bin10]|tara:strand:+ start:3152 stop:3616 length:465 start_codon:yes stop_codon:yes gene_type:complete